MGQINFIWGLIGELLSLGAYVGLNWEDWNLKRPDLIFTKLIDWNQRPNCKKIKVLGSIKGQIDKIQDQGPNHNRRVTSGFQLKLSGA